MAMIDVTDATFEEAVLDRSTQVPVVVDLWAPWCGPCQTLGPIIERRVDATDGAVELAKVNVDDNPRSPADLPGPVHPGRVRHAGRQGGRQLHRRPARGGGGRVRGQAGPAAERGRPAGRARPGRPEEPLRQALELEPDHAGAILAPGRAAHRRGRRPTRPWPCSAGSPRRPRPAACRPRPGWPRSRSTVTDAASTPCSTACSTGSRTTTTPARSSSTCSRPSDPTTLGPSVPQGAGRPAVLSRPAVLTAAAAGGAASRAAVGRRGR